MGMHVLLYFLGGPQWQNFQNLHFDLTNSVCYMFESATPESSGDFVSASVAVSHLAARYCKPQTQT